MSTVLNRKKNRFKLVRTGLNRSRTDRTDRFDMIQDRFGPVIYLFIIFIICKLPIHLNRSNNTIQPPVRFSTSQTDRYGMVWRILVWIMTKRAITMECYALEEKEGLQISAPWNVFVMTLVVFECARKLLGYRPNKEFRLIRVCNKAINMQSSSSI